jgi:hypothetical protein
MNEFCDSLVEALKKRTSNHLLGTFSIFWAICHWQLFVVLFFVSEDNILLFTNKLKNDYLLSLLTDFSKISTWINWIAPFIFTWLLIWVLPKLILIPAYRKECEYKTEKKKIKITMDNKIKILETEIERESVEKLKYVSERIDREKEIKEKDPTILWQEEFEQFKKLPLSKNFKYITEAIYKKQGWFNTHNFVVPKDVLAYSHSNGLIAFSNKENSQIELTDKGKFFVKNYLNEEGSTSFE